jgi:hypothetical protein
MYTNYGVRDFHVTSETFIAIVLISNVSILYYTYRTALILLLCLCIAIHDALLNVALLIYMWHQQFPVPFHPLQQR